MIIDLDQRLNSILDNINSSKFSVAQTATNINALLTQILISDLDMMSNMNANVLTSYNFDKIMHYFDTLLSL